jgi:hypothetical protein
MQHRAATKNLAFIVTSRFVDSSLYQRDSFCAELLSFGDSAIALRQGDRLREVSHALSSLPLPEHIKAIGQYFNGWTARDRETRRASLEYAASYAPPVYRARAILSLAGLARNTGDDRWPQLYAEAVHQARRAQDVYTAVHAGKMLAVRRAVEGDHPRAIDDLESLWPMVRLIAKRDPATYYDWLNSLAFELSEVGRLDEAARAIRIVSASPLIAFNPEWRETAREIEQQQQAAPLIITVPELKPQRAPVVAVVITPRAGTGRRRRLLCRQQLSPLTFITRAQIRAGPRAPPVGSSRK